MSTVVGSKPRAKRVKLIAAKRFVRYMRQPTAVEIGGVGAYRARRAVAPRRRAYRQSEVREEGSIGSRIGSKVGGFVGHGVQQLIKSITGFGDYSIHGNSLMEGGLSPPVIVNSVNTGGFIVRHREYIADINATTAFTLQSFDINPGLAASFPWLSQIAEGFDEYTMRGLVYEFKSMSSDAVLSASTSSALGTVIMATQYNSALSNFADKKTMENYEFANSSKPSCSFLHPVECARRLTPVDQLYVRTGAVPAGQDQRLYDLGNFQIATQGMQAASGVCGELWATFEIEFYKPKLVSSLGTELLTDHFKLGGTLSAANPFGTASVLQSGSNLGCTLPTSVLLQFPSYVNDGNFMLTWQVTGTSTAVTCPAITVNNIQSLSLWQNDSANAINNNPGDSSKMVYIVYTFKITGPNAQIGFGTAGTFPTAVANGDLWINQINGNIGT